MIATGGGALTFPENAAVLRTNGLIIPVSYTHLDVYKRQGMEWVVDKSVIDFSFFGKLVFCISLFNCVGFSDVGLSGVGFSNIGSVSYTHLNHFKGLSMLFIHGNQEAGKHDDNHCHCRKARPCAVFEQKEKRQSHKKCH